MAAVLAVGQQLNSPTSTAKAPAAGFALLDNNWASLSHNEIISCFCVVLRGKPYHLFGPFVNQLYSNENLW